jgi:flavin reductase (DIM6/NTAB) family NADH-FMN oxidoreductase RutF
MFKTTTSLSEAGHVQARPTALLCVQENLMAASWHMPISKEPFRYAVAVREENLTHTLLELHKTFTLNFLPFEHIRAIDTAGRYHGHHHDKLSLTGLASQKRSEYDDLLLDEADFIYECHVNDVYKNGDHTIFIADVDKIHYKDAAEHQPTLFLGRGTYATLAETVQVPMTTK